MVRRLIAGLAAAVLVPVSLASTGLAAEPRSHVSVTAISAGIRSSESRIHFTSKTILVARAIVKKNLVGISSTGVFMFRHDAGALAELATGKVMLLQGSDALMVTKLARKHGRLLVSTKPADLTQVISSGRVTFSGPPNFKNAVLQKIVVPKPTAKASSDFVTPTYPYVGSPPAARGARSAGAGSLSVQGSSGVFGYSLTFTPASAGRLDVTGTICLGTGSICGNGPSAGVDAEINVTGYVDVNSTSGGITVNGGSVTNSDLQIKGLATHLHFTYTVARGNGSTGNSDPPVLHIPVGIDYTLPGEIPLYVKVQLGLLVKIGTTSKNSVVHGGLDISTNGTDDDLSQQGKSISGTESGDHVTGNVLDQSDGGAPASVTLGPAGVVVAFQFPKIGLGLGYTSVNGIAYVDVITTIGQTTGAALAGMFCSSFDVVYSIGGGVEAQIGGGLLGLAFASPRHVFYPKAGTPPFTTQDPGCPKI
jgi:hypothetical protein